MDSTKYKYMEQVEEFDFENDICPETTADTTISTTYICTQISQKWVIYLQPTQAI